MGIKVLMPLAVNFHNKILIADNLVGREISNEFNKLIKNFEKPLQNFNEDFIRERNLAETLKVLHSYEYGTKRLSQKFGHYVKML